MNNKHIEKQAKELIESHLEIFNRLPNEMYPLDSYIEHAKVCAIISAELCKDQFLQAPNILFWKNVIQAIKDYKYE